MWEIGRYQYRVAKWILHQNASWQVTPTAQKKGDCSAQTAARQVLGLSLLTRGPLEIPPYLDILEPPMGKAKPTNQPTNQLTNQTTNQQKTSSSKVKLCFSILVLWFHLLPWHGNLGRVSVILKITLNFLFMRRYSTSFILSAWINWVQIKLSMGQIQVISFFSVALSDLCRLIYLMSS